VCLLISLYAETQVSAPHWHTQRQHRRLLFLTSESPVTVNLPKILPDKSILLLMSELALGVRHQPLQPSQRMPFAVRNPSPVASDPAGTTLYARIADVLMALLVIGLHSDFVSWSYADSSGPNHFADKFRPD
jgi:hypothetical protein